MANVRVMVQYIKSCPLKNELIRRVEEAISLSGCEVDFKKVEIRTEEEANQFVFRGSPTLLINGADFEGIPPPRTPLPVLRLYRKGLPSIQAIAERIKEKAGN